MAFDEQHTHLTVCGRCGGLCGRVTSEGHVQDCFCRPAGRKWVGFDFPRHVELCGLCAVVVIRSGSRWSTLLCPDCSTAARTINEIEGFAVIPISRHALPNSIRYGEHPLARPSVATVNNVLGGLRAARADQRSWVQARVQAAIGSVDIEVALETYRTHAVSPEDPIELAQQFMRWRRVQAARPC